MTGTPSLECLEPHRAPPGPFSCISLLPPSPCAQILVRPLLESGRKKGRTVFPSSSPLFPHPHHMERHTRHRRAQQCSARILVGPQAGSALRLAVVPLANSARHRSSQNSHGREGQRASLQGEVRGRCRGEVSRPCPSPHPVPRSCTNDALKLSLFLSSEPVEVMEDWIIQGPGQSNGSSLVAERSCQRLVATQAGGRNRNQQRPTWLRVLHCGLGPGGLRITAPTAVAKPRSDQK